MIDLHSHCLPGIDDGAKTVDMSVKMLKDSLAQGVTCCVATPHCILHKEEELPLFLEKRRQAAQALAACGADGLPELLLGAEVFLDNDISGYDGLPALCLGNSRYLLVEFPMRNTTLYYADWLYNLTLRKITPVIAHIERYDFFESLMDDLEMVHPVYQINAGTLLDFFGRRFVKKLLKRGGRFVIASDMHGDVYRKNHMQEALHMARRIAPHQAEDLFQRTAENILGK